MKQIKMGALYINDVVQKAPVNPVWDGDIPQYDGISNIQIRDVPADTPEALITWIEVPTEKWSPVGTLLIADRVILSNVSWTDLAKAGFINGVPVMLDGKKYICKLAFLGNANNKRSVWNDALHATVPHNEIWHWKGIYFWGANYSTDISRRVMRGNTSAFCWSDGQADTRSPHVGFRPVLEPLERTEAAIKPDKADVQNAKTIGKSICEILHVKQNEMFMFKDRWYMVRYDGMMCRLYEKNIWRVNFNSLADMITHPDKINHAFSFSQKDKEDIASFVTLFGSEWVKNKKIQRNEDGVLGISGDGDFWMTLDTKLFPSVPPCHSFDLSKAA